MKGQDYRRQLLRSLRDYLGVLLIPLSAAAAPEIDYIEGEFAEGGSVIVDGRGFSVKADARPLFWWTADGGKTPSSLGRTRNWAGGFDRDNQRSTKIVANGSTHSFRFDHGSSAAGALGEIEFDGTRLYVWRKVYDDFDITKDFAIRTRFQNLDGAFEVGQTVQGQRSRTTGVISRVRDNGNGTGALIYEVNSGSVASGSSFLVGEEIVSTSAQAVVDEPSGTFRSFNHKLLRLWSTNTTGSRNSVYAFAQGYDRAEYSVSAEGTEGIIPINSADFRQLPDAWRIEQLIYEASDVDVRNGRFRLGINGVFAYDNLIITRTTERPWLYGEIMQSQVSNGAQPDSWVYYDSVYVDDSWHRVLVSSAETWGAARDVEVQIPTSWSPDKIELQVRLGSLDLEAPRLYLYVFDRDGNVNSQGKMVYCSDCPVAPSVSVD